MVVRLDLKNAYNAASRSAMLRRFSEHPQLAPLLPLLHATLARADRLAVGAERRQLFDARMGRSDTAEGLQQGAPPSSGVFCVCVNGGVVHRSFMARCLGRLPPSSNPKSFSVDHLANPRYYIIPI